MKTRGFSMIEVLVALTVAALGLLGTLALQARGLSVQKDAFQRRHAADLVAQLAERMRANHLGVITGRYAFDFDPDEATPRSVATCAVPCTAADVALRDLDEWRIELRRRLPRSAAYVQWNGSTASGVRIAVAWAEVAVANADKACEALGPGVRLGAEFRCYATQVLP